MKGSETSRRKFISNLGIFGTAAIAGSCMSRSAAVGPTSASLHRKKKRDPNENIQIGLIGAGGRGVVDAIAALSHEGIKLLSVCDLYETRRAKAMERFGPDLVTTRDYREVLERNDIDAVIIATPDHWHQQICLEAMENGKHVYCEKPMVHSLDEGPTLIKAQKKTGMVFMVGSQLLSSLGYEKAKELYQAGAIGELNYTEGVFSRRTARGAWNYPIPEDASSDTIDWDRFIKSKTDTPFSPERFFRWRKYLDYGTGMNGDLFVHIISGLHFVTDSLGPDRIYATGGIRFWNDGREVPDVLIGTFDYPKTAQHPGFNLSLRCNFVDGSKGSSFYVMRIVGSEGILEVQTDKVVLGRNKALSGVDPYTHSNEVEKESFERGKMLDPQEMVFEVEESYKGSDYDHFGYFFEAIRHGKDVVEDAVFGYRACAPALACHQSYLENEAVLWDPVKMEVS